MFSACGFALPTDITQKMNIVADSTTLNYKTGINQYDGNVRVDQGETHLLADQLITQADEKHKINLVTALGKNNLVEYTTLPKAGDAIIHAKAKIIKFYPEKSLVILEGDVNIIQAKNSFNGPLIYYNIKDQTIKAPATNKGRSTIIIEPAKS